MRTALLLLAFVSFPSPRPARAESAPLIAREILLGNPERVLPRISPDGKRLAWLAPDKAGVLQIWVKTLGQPTGKPDDKLPADEDARIVTADKHRGIRRYAWAQDDRTLLYLQDADGDEN